MADELRENFDILVEMEPKHIDDVLPLISVQKSQLNQFKRNLEKQELNGVTQNPIYYFSEKLKVCMAKKQNFNDKSQIFQTFSLIETK